MAGFFHFKVDIAAVAEKVNKTREVVEDTIAPALETLAAATHGFVVRYAQDKLQNNPYLLQEFFKDKEKNVRWQKVAKGIWVVELDESVSWIEEGLPARSMATTDWLLKPSKDGKWPKKAKDGSLYRPIPFTGFKSSGPAQINVPPGYETIIKNAMKQQGISMSGLVKDDAGQPKLGVIAKLNITPPGPQSQFPGMYSKPRSVEDAAKFGLRPHGGIFKLAGAAVIQRQVGIVTKGKNKGKGKFAKEVVMMRMVSSKHKAEGRWMYPEIKPLGAMQAGFDEANKQWAQILQQIETQLNRI